MFQCDWCDAGKPKKSLHRMLAFLKSCRCDGASNPCTKKDSKATCKIIAGGGYKCTCSSPQYSGQNCEKSWFVVGKSPVPHSHPHNHCHHHRKGAIPTARKIRAPAKIIWPTALILSGVDTSVHAPPISTPGEIARRAGALL